MSQEQVTEQDTAGVLSAFKIREENTDEQEIEDAFKFFEQKGETDAEQGNTPSTRDAAHRAQRKETSTAGSEQTNQKGKTAAQSSTQGGDFQERGSVLEEDTRVLEEVDRKPMQRQGKKRIPFSAEASAKQVQEFYEQARNDPERTDFDIPELTKGIMQPEIREAYNLLLSRAKQANPRMSFAAAKQFMSTIPDPLTAARQQAGFLENLQPPQRPKMSFG